MSKLEQLHELLRTKATRDKASGRPLLYLSTDAHALRRFVDETWQAPWKMINGIRLWCIDRNTGQPLHLGGEYTWNDCREVVERLLTLQRSGHLPPDGRYPEGLRVQPVIVVNGQDWIAGQVLPLFPDALRVLDLYHVLAQVVDAARIAYPRNAARVARLVNGASRALGLHEPRPKACLRKGPRRARQRRRRPVAQGDGQQLLELLAPSSRDCARPGVFAGRRCWTTSAATCRGWATPRRSAAWASVVARWSRRTRTPARSDSSGQAAAGRLKPLNVRMLALVGRWNEFWAQPELTALLADSTIGLKAATG